MKNQFRVRAQEPATVSARELLTIALARSTLHPLMHETAAKVRGARTHSIILSKIIVPRPDHAGATHGWCVETALHQHKVKVNNQHTPHQPEFNEERKPYSPKYIVTGRVNQGARVGKACGPLRTQECSD